MFKSSAGKDSHVWLPSIFPWVIVGDFNAITFTDKHKGCTFHYYGRKAFLFNNFISNNSLIDVGFSSSMYSWCNGQRGQSRRWVHLDRFLVNSFWLSCINKSHLNYLPKIFSDHSPLCMNFSHSICTSQKIFRFENFWLENDDYISTIINSLCINPTQILCMGAKTRLGFGED